jgi:hypothetical protein
LRNTADEPLDKMYKVVITYDKYTLDRFENKEIMNHFSVDKNKCSPEKDGTSLKMLIDFEKLKQELDVELSS